jgi:ABC-2 type transport system permease protein
MCLLGLWLFFVILIPGILNNLADTFYPVPSRLALINAQRQAVLHAAENGTNLVSKIYDEHPDFFAGKLDYSKTDREVNSYAVQIETEKIAIPFDKNFRLQTQNQQQFISQFQVFSPAIILQQQLNQLAGHGPARKASFENQTDKFHQQIKTYFRGKVFKKERLQPPDYEQMPQFMYQEISVNSGNNWSLLWAIGLAAAAFVLFTWMNLNKFKAVGSK